MLPNQPERYTATMILDSVSPAAIRLPTIHVTMPRIVLAEFNTHRRKTRNSRSTRAVPTSKLIQEVRDNPYRPLYWLKNKPGMQASEPMSDVEVEKAKSTWFCAAWDAAGHADELFTQGLHKQWAGRVLEPFLFTDVLVSATDWANFMALRDDSDAQPEIELVAQRIRDCLDNSTPKLLQPGDWHMPYIRHEDWALLAEMDIDNYDDRITILRKVSAARCARVSYRPFDGSASIEAEIQRFDRLVSSWPVHASPTEHVATPDEWYRHTRETPPGHWAHPEDHRNFKGWRQFRAFILNDTVNHMPPRRH